MGKKKVNTPQNVINQAQSQYESTLKPSSVENEIAPLSSSFTSNYNAAAGQNTQDYSSTMGAYDKFRQGMGDPTKFTFNNVSAGAPKELGESYSMLREAMPGYRDFASTGGYSPTDVQELRARGVAPIRSAYGNTMMEMDRARSIGGGAPNYIAAASRAQRELPGQMADATTSVNAGLADSIRQGKQFGLQGISGTGSTLGGMASGQAGRELSASIANQGADMQAQGMGETSLQNRRGSELASLGGQSSLYGTTPGLSSMFGNQALDAYRSRAGMEQSREQFGLGLMDAQLRGNAQKSPPWWQTALGIAGTVAPYVGMAFGAPKLPVGAK